MVQLQCKPLVGRTTILDWTVDLENRMSKVIASMLVSGMPVSEEVLTACIEESRVTAEAQLSKLDEFVKAELPEKWALFAPRYTGLVRCNDALNNCWCTFEKQKSYPLTGSLTIPTRHSKTEGPPRTTAQSTATVLAGTRSGL